MPDNQISNVLKTLFAVSENYPNLKASESFIQLQSRISSLEGEISDRREFYNDSVNMFNIRIRQIPDRFIASPAGFSKKDFFKTNPEEIKDVEINL